MMEPPGSSIAPRVYKVSASYFVGQIRTKSSVSVCPLLKNKERKTKEKTKEKKDG